MTVRELLRQRPDSRGECDRCHLAPRELRTDNSQPGEFAYCADCLADLAATPRQRRHRVTR